MSDVGQTRKWTILTGSSSELSFFYLVGQLVANLFEMKATLLPKSHSARDWSAVACRAWFASQPQPGHQSGAASLSHAKSIKLEPGAKAC